MTIECLVLIKLFRQWILFCVWFQSLQHNPNGRFVVVCGDGEYIIYTGLAWRNRSFGSALEFVWSSDGEYAVRESTSRIKIFSKAFQVLIFLKCITHWEYACQWDRLVGKIWLSWIELYCSGKEECSTNIFCRTHLWRGLTGNALKWLCMLLWLGGMQID